MALINCPECQKEVSDSAKTCPHCGCELSTGGVKTIVEKGVKIGKNLKPFTIIMCICALVIVSALLILSNSLLGNDRIAYNLIVDAAENFKDPSSVRIVSGTIEKDFAKKDSHPTLKCSLSAVNGFGSRTSSYYQIYKIGRNTSIRESAYPGKEYTSTTSLDIDKINKALARKLSVS